MLNSLCSALLTNTLGASKVFEAITARSTVTKVNVAHHHLGSEGAVELFKRLSSPAGRRYRHQITTIDLAHNHIGDVGLEAISDYLLNNRKLKTLILQRVSHGALCSY